MKVNLIILLLYKSHLISTGTVRRKTFFLHKELMDITMRDEKEGRSKQGQTNNKAKQYNIPNMYDLVE